MYDKIYLLFYLWLLHSYSLVKLVWVFVVILDVLGMHFVQFCYQWHICFVKKKIGSFFSLPGPYSSLNGIGIICLLIMWQHLDLEFACGVKSLVTFSICSMVIGYIKSVLQKNKINKTYTDRKRFIMRNWFL